MESNNKNINILAYMAYGDSVGFLRENKKSINNENLQPFTYSYNKDIKLQAEAGQWSYITQLMLINCKCLVDNKDKRHVFIDYRRMMEEIKLWQYYRCGMPLNYIYKLQLGKKYYEDDFYWNDKRGDAFSRIIPIVLVNKNFNAAQEEVYKNIIYTNRHPQVILTGLLLLRTTYFLLNNAIINKEELIDALKNYLINLQLVDLEEYVKAKLSNQYKIKFEQEKINYLIDLDRIKDIEIYSSTNSDSKDILITSLTSFLELHKAEGAISHDHGFQEKEIDCITYGLLGIAKKLNEINVSQIKDINFIINMDSYLLKLKEYEVERSIFEKIDHRIELFGLNKGSVLKHPLLNNIRIKDKKESDNYTELIIESKSGEYRFIKQKNKTV